MVLYLLGVDWWFGYCELVGHGLCVWVDCLFLLFLLVWRDSAWHGLMWVFWCFLLGWCAGFVVIGVGDLVLNSVECFRLLWLIGWFVECSFLCGLTLWYGLFVIAVSVTWLLFNCYAVGWDGGCCRSMVGGLCMSCGFGVFGSLDVVVCLVWVVLLIVLFSLVL